MLFLTHDSLIPYYNEHCIVPVKNRHCRQHKKEYHLINYAVYKLS